MNRRLNIAFEKEREKRVKKGRVTAWSPFFDGLSLFQGSLQRSKGGVVGHFFLMERATKKIGNCKFRKQEIFEWGHFLVLHVLVATNSVKIATLKEGSQRGARIARAAIITCHNGTTGRASRQAW